VKPNVAGFFLQARTPAALHVLTGRKSMLRKIVFGALGVMAIMFSSTAFAQGTAAEAKAMLEKAVAAVKADKAKTLDLINKGEGGFLELMLRMHWPKETFPSILDGTWSPPPGEKAG
jgi:hypothetical protein